MTGNEFAGWWSLFKAHFPEVQKFVLGDKDADEQAEILAVWQRTLGDVTFDEANYATQALYDGKLERPREWNRYPVVIRNYTMEARLGNRADASLRYVRERSFSCLRCRDSGFVEVYNNEKVTKKIAAGQDVKSFYVGAIACDCSFGQKRIDLNNQLPESKQRRLPQYNERGWCLFNPRHAGREEKIAYIKDWIENRLPTGEFTADTWQPTATYKQALKGSRE